MARYLFLDLETTGLDASIDQITEAAWITDRGLERQFFVQHDRLPDEYVLAKTDYLTRIAPSSPKQSVTVVLTQLSIDCDNARLVSGGDVYLVGANPAFDDRFLRLAFKKRLGIEPPYHYHLIDVETLAMGVLGLTAPPRLKELRALLGLDGENPNAHSALSDAREVKLIFEALRAPQKPA